MTEQSKIPLPPEDGSGGDKGGKSLFERAEGAFGGYEGFKPAPVPSELAPPANRRWKKPAAKVAPVVAEPEPAETAPRVAESDPPASAGAEPALAAPVEAPQERTEFTAPPQRIDRARLQQEALIVPGGPVTALVE